MGANEKFEHDEPVVKIRVRELNYRRGGDDEETAIPASALAEIEPGETDVLEQDAQSITNIRRHWSGQASRMFWLQRAQQHVPATAVHKAVKSAHDATLKHAERIGPAVLAHLPPDVAAYVAKLVSEQLRPRLDAELQAALAVMPIDTTGKTGVLYGGMVAGSGKGATTAEADSARSNSVSGKRQARARKA